MDAEHFVWRITIITLLALLAIIVSAWVRGPWGQAALHRIAGG